MFLGGTVMLLYILRKSVVLKLKANGFGALLNIEADRTILHSQLYKLVLNQQELQPKNVTP